MKKLMLLFVLAGLSMRDIQSLDLVKVGAWTHKDEYWDEKNKSLGLKGTKYLYTLINNHVLCSEWRETDFPSYDTRYYIKNYLTGEITYRFEKGIRFYGVEDQYGAYIFLLKGGGLVLFDVEEKREYIPGEPLKRPEHIYYTKGELYKRQFFKHNISTGEIEEVRFGDLSRDELDILQNSNRGYRQTLEYTGDSQLRLYNNYWSYILRLNESMTEIVSVTEQKKKPPSATFLIPINEDKYIGLNSTTWPYPGDDVDYYYILFLDKNGRRQKEYKEIAVVHNDGYRDDTSLAGLCLVSPDRQYVLLFNSNSSVDKEGYVYKIIYLSVGILNDDRVRVRAEPNLTGATLGVVNRVDKVEILETGQEKQKIGDMESVWYKIRTDAGVEGWVFGAYVDMVDMIGTN